MSSSPVLRYLVLLTVQSPESRVLPAESDLWFAAVRVADHAGAAPRWLASVHLRGRRGGDRRRAGDILEEREGRAQCGDRRRQQAGRGEVPWRVDVRHHGNQALLRDQRAQQWTR